MQELPDVDIAVVGGGIGGIYAGWRLMTSPRGAGLAANWAKARGTLKVALFEGSDRIGGRLLSARSPLMPDTTAEIGGMRYVSPAQKRVKGLVENVLRLPTHRQTVDVSSNIAFLRGRLLRNTALGNPTALPYWFDPDEAAWLAARESSNPAMLIARELIRLMPKIPEKLKSGQLRPYLETIEIDGLPLWRHAFWNLLAKHISPDGYNAARATIGYDCLGGNTNALDLITEFFDFTPEVQYLMVNQGYEAVPWQLQQKFLEAGGEITVERWLDGFVGFKLADGSQGVQLNFRDGGRPLSARAIVLAMPRRAIELLRPEGEILGSANTKFRHDLAAVSGIPLFKLFLLYSESWWQEAGVSRGRSLTDMPLRQCYYWPVGPKGDGVPKRGERSLVMAYDDLLNVDFWAALDTRSEVHKAGLQLGAHVPHALPMFGRAAIPDAPPPPDPFSARLRANWEMHKATKPMVEELHRQLLQMHGIDSAPEPIDAAYMDWSRDPYGGGVHLWNVNYNSEETLTRMTQPVEEFPCYICGEAYSTNQTWAEGALETADIVLHRLGLPAPDWHT